MGELHDTKVCPKCSKETLYYILDTGNGAETMQCENPECDYWFDNDNPLGIGFSSELTPKGSE